MVRGLLGALGVVWVAGSVSVRGEAQEVRHGALYAPAGGPGDSVAPPLPREFRAVWLATVDNIDWPSKPGLPVAQQQAELIALFDLAQRTRLNAIVFQVRPSADALYPSRLEPWSYFLTGAMGRAPSPRYDPLAFAIDEAHKRGIELHAWFNPYRSRHPADRSPAASTHVSRKHPAWHKRYGPYGWMDPGEPGVRQQTLDVILDVVRRYDVDGVHMDDYFYPYPERTRRGEIPFPDDRSWSAYTRKGGSLSRDSWRRWNVDTLIQAIYAGVKKEKPWVKVGLSPFGIWRPGFPANVRGFDAWDRLYADSRRWLREGWVDYFTPQLYWRLSAAQQPYADLLAWWRGENVGARHLWPGNYTGRASAARSASWPVSEVFDQIHETRSQLGDVSGNVHFSMSAFVANTDGLVERLTAGPYAEPALVPASPWLSSGIVEAPVVRATETGGGLRLRVERVVPPTPRTSPALPPDKTRTAPVVRTLERASDPRWWVVRARYGDSWRAWIVDARTHDIVLDREPSGEGPRWVVVSAIDRVGGESALVRAGQ